MPLKHKSFILFIIIFLIIFCNAIALYSVDSLLTYNAPWVGDLNGMLKRDTIRVLVPYSKTFYFLDGAEQKGLTYEMLKEFEKFINKKYNRKNIQVRIVVIPTRRDQLLNALVDGIGDIAAGNLTITSKREKKVDFSTPFLTDVNEIIVTGPKQPEIKSLQGLNLYIRKSSSYYESITKLNRKLAKLGKSPIRLSFADELLEDEDILEMINAGMIPMTVIDSHKAKFWEKIFKNLKFYYNLKLRKNGSIAWAFRKNSPQLKNVIDEFVKSHKKGTLMGNILFTKYLKIQNGLLIRFIVITSKDLMRHPVSLKNIQSYIILTGFLLQLSLIRNHALIKT